MKIKLIRLLFGLVVLLPPVVGYSNPFGDLFKNSKDVAVKLAELHEDKDVEIWGLDFSPDGKYLAATSPNLGKVHVWDWQNKRIVQTLEKKGTDLTTTEPVRYSPDGRLLVWCGGVIARIWNTDTWELVHTIDGTSGVTAAGGGCNSAGFTPDGKSLILVLDRVPDRPGDNLIIYDTSTWESVWGLRTVPFYPQSLAISPDGKFAAIGGGVNNPARWPFSGQPTTPRPTFGNPPLPDQSVIAIVDVVQGAIIRTIPSARHGQIAWSPDGAHITVAGAGEVTVFDVQSGKQVIDEPIKSGHISVRYTPDGKYLIEGIENGKEAGSGIRIWDGQHRELLQEIPGDVRGLAVSRAGHYFAAGSFKKITVWKLK